MSSLGSPVGSHSHQGGARDLITPGYAPDGAMIMRRPITRRSLLSHGSLSHPLLSLIHSLKVAILPYMVILHGSLYSSILVMMAWGSTSIWITLNSRNFGIKMSETVGTRATRGTMNDQPEYMYS